MSLSFILGGCRTAQNVPFCYVPRMRKKRQRVESGVIFLIYYYSVICIWHSLFSLYRRMWQMALCRLSLWADRGKWAAGKRKIASISSPLNLQTITPFSYFRREVLFRFCGTARWAENKKNKWCCFFCLALVWKAFILRARQVMCAPRYGSLSSCVLEKG